MTAAPPLPEPRPDCPLCPRLAAFRQQNRAAYPAFHNAPVPSFGGRDAELLIVGLAPGLKGANRTGRPFTGDFAGDLLYRTLLDLGLAVGNYDRRPDDGLRLRRCRVSNAVRCVPPENKPTPAEVRTCGAFLAAEIAGLTKLKAILALGRVAHDAVLSALGSRRASARFSHGAVHDLPKGLRLVDSYHCSRYNTQTGVLTETMFRDAVAAARACVERPQAASGQRSRGSARR
ncbi:MAG: uracil-DNA glycosylase [Dongiaceae bacterium]